MTGSLVHDTLAPTLHSAVVITSAATTTGTGVQVNYPGLVRFKQVAGTITGTTVTLDTEIQGCETSGGTYITIAKFDTLNESDDNETHYVECYVNSAYVRAITVSTGTVTTATLTVTMEELHYHRNRTAPSTTADSA